MSLSPPIISEREKALFKGAREKSVWGPFEIVMYWEPHFEMVKGEQKLAKSFTIDVAGPIGPSLAVRYRFERLAEADAKFAELDATIMIEAGKMAFGIA